MDNSKNDSCEILFWDLSIASENSLQRKVAHAALKSFVSTLDRHLRIRDCQLFFKTWKRVIDVEKICDLNTKISSLEKNSASLESKNAKLKALLARTHQANQRNMEDTNNFRKAQQATQKELDLVKQKEDQERIALIEQVRLRNLEAEFNYSVDVAIQLAAERMMKHSPLNDISDSSIKIKSQDMTDLLTLDSFRHDNDCLRTQLEAEKDQRIQIQAKLDDINSKYTELQNKMTAIVSNEQKFQERAIVMEKSWKNEESLRKELELELELMIKSRQNIMVEHSYSIESRLEQQRKKYEEEISSWKVKNSNLLDDFSKLKLENQLVLEEIDRLRNRLRSMDSLESEVQNLRNLNMELRRLIPSSKNAILSSRAMSQSSSIVPVNPIVPLDQSGSSSCRKCLQHAEKIETISGKIAMLRKDMNWFGKNLDGCLDLLDSSLNEVGQTHLLSLF